MSNGTQKLGDRLKERSEKAVQQALASEEKARHEKQRSDEALDRLIRERYEMVGREPLIKNIESALSDISAKGENRATFCFEIYPNLGAVVSGFIPDCDQAVILSKHMMSTGWDGVTNVRLVLSLIREDLEREGLVARLSEETTETSLEHYSDFLIMSISW